MNTFEKRLGTLLGARTFWLAAIGLLAVVADILFDVSIDADQWMVWVDRLIKLTELGALGSMPFVGHLLKREDRL